MALQDATLHSVSFYSESKQREETPLGPAFFYTETKQLKVSKWAYEAVSAWGPGLFFQNLNCTFGIKVFWGTK